MRLLTVLLSGVLLLAGLNCLKDPPNRRPEPPFSSRGIDTARVGALVTFRWQATDPDTESVRFRVYWGDTCRPVWSDFGTTSPFTRLCTLDLRHTWYAAGDYVIRAIAQDATGDTSDLSEARVFTIVDTLK